MEKEENTEKPLFIVVVEDAATILCEPHAKAYAEIMASLDKQFTIVEMMVEDAKEHQCMACDMQEELNRPRIITLH
jgi:hypothetical protein